MAAPTKLLTHPYSAYHRAPLPEEDRELTHVERGSPGGEYLRRFWQPVALSSELGEPPLKVRILGEELVLFRTKSGDIGLLELHCSHRGTSLEYGICEERGLRCCYHGWLYGVDGAVEPHHLDKQGGGGELDRVALVAALRRRGDVALEELANRVQHDAGAHARSLGRAATCRSARTPRRAPSSAA